MRHAPRMMIPLMAMACSLPPIDEQPTDCEAFSITRVSTGETYASLAEAISLAHTNDAFCLGAGTYDLDSVAIQRLSDSVYSDALTIQGAGSHETFLEATQAEDTLLYVEMEGTLSIEGLTFSGGRARLKATDLELKDVAFQDYTGWERGLTLKGDTVTVDGLTISGNQMDYASGLYVAADTLGRIQNLDVFDNKSDAGYLIELHGPIDLSDSQIIGNQLSKEQPGYDLMELFGPSTVEDVMFLRNDFNGPALRAYDSLDATGLVISENSTQYAAVLTLMGETILTDSMIYGNTGVDGAIGLYDESATADIEAINPELDQSANAPCDLVGKPCEDGNDVACDAQCLNAALGSDALHCDAYGCE
jgi:hypothetical protein